MPNSAETRNQLVISYLTLRKAIGWLGVLLPAMLLFTNMVLNGCCCLLPSISHYYYTPAGDVFVGILIAVGIFLLSYKGYETTPDGKPDYRDRLVANVAGLMAVGVALFPTNTANFVSCNNLYLNDITWRNLLHYVCAGSFFILLAYMSYFRFTISKHAPAEWTKRKKIRNNLYKICGAIILSAIILIPLADFLPNAEKLHTTFWLEWVALLAFGTSWLVKGQLILAD